jgi:hypothetical protein
MNPERYQKNVKVFRAIIVVGAVILAAVIISRLDTIAKPGFLFLTIGAILAFLWWAVAH